MYTMPKEYDDDKRPILDEEFIPPYLDDTTGEDDAQWANDIEHIINEEQGIISENELLAEGVIFDNDLAEENMENDYFDQDNNDI